MSKRMKKHSPAAMAVKIAMVPFTVGGGLAIGFARNSSNAVAPQTTGPASSNATMVQEAESLGGKVRYDVIAFGPEGVEYVFETR